MTMKTFTKESLCDTNKERFLSMHDEFPFGCGQYKGQSLCMWVILTQKDVIYELCELCMFWVMCDFNLYNLLLC